LIPPVCWLSYLAQHVAGRIGFGDDLRASSAGFSTFLREPPAGPADSTWRQALDDSGEVSHNTARQLAAFAIEV